jgi:aspartyl-tRNA(Asn)/glutamyl-tRNA(Gln) amidotransferase subunit A
VSKHAQSYATVQEIAARVTSRAVSAVDVTETALERIAQHDQRLNSFIRVVPDGALEAAREVDDAVRAGRPVGPLAGVPVALKDLIDLAGVPTTAGAHRRFHHTPPTDASVVTRLRSAGAVIVGKTGLHEFAYGVTNINPHTGPVRNPWDLERIPGGSSGGSGAAVAAGFVAAALGTDTGGSIRIPAGLCGVTGFKPTFGRVPVDGVVPLSWTLDHVGPLARTAADAAVVFSVLAQVPEVLAELSRGLTGLRLSVPEEFFWEELDRDVMSCCQDAVRVLTSGGAVRRSTAFPHASECGAAAAVILAAEAAAYHERHLREHPDAFGDDVRVRLDRGLFLSAADYLAAQRARAYLIREATRALEGVDILVVPTTPAPAARIEGDTSHGARASLALSVRYTRFTNPFNLLGFPALSIPCGLSRDGLPIGLQIVGRPFDDATVLRVGHAYQQLTDWHRRQPSI